METENHCENDSVRERAILIKISESYEYLMKDARQNSRNTIIDRFNLRINTIELEAHQDEKKLIELLSALNNEVEQLIKSLLWTIQFILQNVNDKETAFQAYKALQELYPISTLYTNTNGNEKIPYLKIPSVKVVFVPTHETQNIKEYVKGALPLKHMEQLLQVDFDGVPFAESIEPNETQKNSLLIRLFGSPEIMLREIEEIKKSFNDKFKAYQDILKIVVKPDYTNIPLQSMLFEKYPETEELLEKVFSK